ncbi:hypothetical protein MNBD_ALPHA01-1305 [hydrothermal vent metagenome]|uniref:FecR protein domain-containing protein n=1 Tax=hydrothermal vent metagenome TaxID=652676 RepID=A0A3B0S9W7_9ZZZZ
MKKNDNIKFADDLANEAAEWFLKLRDDDLSRTDYLEWQEWIAESDDHARAFAGAEDCWDALDDIKDLPRVNAGPTLMTKNYFRRIMPVAAGIAATLLVALFLQKDITPSLETTSYQTARAEHKTVRLDDGSQINLGARSIINVNYSDMRRHITLVRGEAVFNVVRDTLRPFVVKTGNGTVTAIGTKFNIHSNDQDVVVTVLEGIVEVNPYSENNTPDHAPLPRVSAGKAVTYQVNGYISEVTDTNVEAAVSWEKGLLVRVDVPLANVIEDVNRYSAREIIIGDAALNNIRFTGTVLNDGIDNWLRGLSVAYPIKVLDSGHNAILLLKKTE